MEAFRNLANAIGHWQRKKKALPAQHARARSAPDPAAAILTDVKPYLRTLLRAPEVSDSVSREAEANIKRIADVCGFYQSASFIYSHVESLSSTNGEETKIHTPRGFELAGELYFLHLLKEVDSIEENTRSLGPKVFRGYCTELFDCFLAGEHVRKGVGYPIMLMEILLNKAAASPDKKSLYLALADQAMQSLEELSRWKFKKDFEDDLRAVRDESKDDAPEPERKNPHKIIDQELLDYLQGLQEDYAVVRDGFEKTNLPRMSTDGTSKLRNYIAYLQELLSATTRGGYLGLTAMLKEVIGRALNQACQEEHGGYDLGAAQDLERLADQEQDLYLVVMSAHHYRKAHELYSLGGDREKAEAAACKLAKLKSDYDPEMLIISQL